MPGRQGQFKLVGAKCLNQIKQAFLRTYIKIAWAACALWNNLTFPLAIRAFIDTGRSGFIAILLPFGQVTFHRFGAGKLLGRKALWQEAGYE
jgi:hypothetical protein